MEEFLQLPSKIRRKRANSEAFSYPVVGEVAGDEGRAEGSSRVNATSCEADLRNKEEKKERDE